MLDVVPPSMDRIIASANCAGVASVDGCSPDGCAKLAVCAVLSFGELSIRLIMLTNAGVCGTGLAAGNIMDAINPASFTPR
jgi:hypothetical protein